MPRRRTAGGRPDARANVGARTYSPAAAANRHYAIEITLANPYTYRATAIANVTGLLIAIGLFALGLAVVVSAALARRFTTPLRQLTDASRALAEGDLTRRVPAAQFRAGSSEIGELAVQFNTMADRLEESVEIIRRDRDRSRDFLADVSHELRTPLAALRTFNQLLMEDAGEDPEAQGRIPRVERRADRAARLARPEPARALEARLRASSSSTFGPMTCGLPSNRRRTSTTPLAKRRGVTGRARPADAARAHPARSAADRPGRREPRRQRRSSSRRGAASSASRWNPRPRARGSTSSTRASASTPTSCPISSSGSIAARVPTRHADQRERPRTGHRPVDRRHAWRHCQRRERAGHGEPLHGPSADRPAERRRHARGRTGRRRDGCGRDAADRRRSADRRLARSLRRISGCGAHRDGNFTVRRSPRESGVGTLESDTEPRLAAHRPGATATCRKPTTP